MLEDIAKAHERQMIKVWYALENEKIVGGKCLNQKTSLKQIIDNRWSSHCATLVNLTLMYSFVTYTLEMMKEDISYKYARGETNGLLFLIDDFDFAFSLYSMKNVTP